MSDALQRLLDEAEIRELVLAFGRALDAKDWEAYGDVFTEDGQFEIFGQRRVGRAEIVAGPARDLARFDVLQHLLTNFSVRVDGDTATATAYVIAVHVPDASEPSNHADIGARYTYEVVRTPDGWRFGSVAIDILWTAGLPFGVEEKPAAPG
jgi:uncharacterized protein (TIGR02246 family)